ncbi:MAG: carbohydrate binding family 9 domain-containing protein [bacterium]|nr:carbohydrate binding family 9 domain-containing protein [bacterium]
MKNNLVVGLLLVAGYAFCAEQAQSQDAVQDAVEAPRLSTAPKIDGRLDEAVWQEAAPLGDLVQVEPDPGAPPTEKTEILIGYDEQKLYIGARCWYSEPQKITSVLKNRDADLLSEDAVKIVLDTFGDRKTAFFFAVNPVGAQIDGLIRSDGDDVNNSWDGIWYSATSRDDQGWTAELAIPFRTLRFPEAEEQTWGLNVMRSIIHKREYVVWQPAEVINPFLSIFKVSAAGRLTGLKQLKPGRSFEIKPYLLAEATRSDVAGDEQDFEAGVDVRKNLTSALTLDLTYNLDFAEAEADNQKVNLTRFPLFYPEKRDFFLEGSSIFYFGERRDLMRSAERIFFFSRRIGLTEDGLHRIPVLGGAKISGELAGLNVGLLNLTTDELTYRDRDGVEHLEPRTNYTALRLQKNVLKGSTVGLMWLNKGVKGGEDNSGSGVDWNFALGKHVKTGGFLAQTSTPPGLEDDDRAGQADVVWDSKSLYASVSYADVGDDFNPEMGFFRRLGVREWRLHFAPVFRPKVWNLRGVWITDEYIHVTDQNGDLETERNLLMLEIAWNNYAMVALKHFSQTEVLTMPFEIRRGVIIPPGRYAFSSYFAGFQTAPGKPVLFFARIHTGDFWDGTFQILGGGLRLRPGPGLYSRIYYEQNDVELPVGDFIAELLSINVTYAVSPTLSGRALIEWQSDDNLNANIAVKWIYKPGAAVYLIYNEFRDLYNQPGDFSGPRDRALVAKMTFYF